MNTFLSLHTNTNIIGRTELHKNCLFIIPLILIVRKASLIFSTIINSICDFMMYTS